jgi:hypothetical protein
LPDTAAALFDADAGVTDGGDVADSVMFGASGGPSAEFSNATGAGDRNDPSPQKKNIVLRMNNPRSSKNGSLPCMIVTFSSGEKRRTPKQNTGV